ncbi:GntR family transcriptional regulator [Polaromonas sp. CG_23.6]|uniref:GntR family transcriptional regulator n=1 Tax=Polaromonas sp. CG_23.6 TaxID=2760709 RepID=UPI0024756C87|nr:GntR family transcriptional regulator [Polaromonas sp. CG_23.6]MDH6186730.1 DNA-binding GntR family transcriptional regulator [Polaromonas sp. CG_23.6]
MPVDSIHKRGEREQAGDEIYEKIYLSILEHRLLPGTKLAEERMAQIFKVSRARIREVLARLAHEQIVEILPKRGAYVAKPTVEDARGIFEARRVIEPAIMLRLAKGADDRQITLLKRHIDFEGDARQRNDKRAIIRLSGEFHNLAAELAGNAALTRSLRELATLTCLIILLYDAPPTLSCRVDEHARIVDAIVMRDGETAASLMLEHLQHIENSVNLQGAVDEADLESIFG